MHRIDGADATPANLFTEGNPTSGAQATVVTADWLNAVQQEICAVVEGAGLALDKLNNAQLLAAIALIALPAGTLQYFAMQAVPTGWLEANGQVVLRTSYPRLFAAIGTNYNTGGESGTQFRLPDLRGYFLRGWDHARGVDAGRAMGTYQADDNKAHTHTYRQGTSTAGPSTAGGGDANMARTWSDAGVTGSAGSESRPVNFAALVCIKT